jgi:general secretion pathway protein L
VLSKLNAKVVIKKLGGEAESSLLSWRRCNDEGRWLSGVEIGNVETLKNSLTGDELDACLLLPGTEVVCQKVSFNKQEKKHLARLIPFELEEDLTEELADLHFAFGAIGAEEAVAAYTNAERIKSDIQVLEAAGLSVNHCLSEPILLERLDNGWGLRLDDYLHVHYGLGLGFSVDRSLASAALASLSRHLSQDKQPDHLLLMAEDQQQLETLRNLLPLDLTQHLVEEQIDTKISDGWDSLNFANISELELRQGSLARQLPLAKWWLEWRTVAVVAGFALVAFLGLNIAEVQINNAKQRNIVEQINQAYRQVVPQGAVADPERQLQQKLSAYESAGSGGSVIAMLAKVAPMIATKEDINLRNLRYDNQRGTMAVTLTAKTYSDALDLSNQIQTTGLTAQLSGVNASGDEQQVQMTITRAAP